MLQDGRLNARGKYTVKALNWHLASIAQEGYKSFGEDGRVVLAADARKQRLGKKNCGLTTHGLKVLWILLDWLWEAPLGNKDWMVRQGLTVRWLMCRSGTRRQWSGLLEAGQQPGAQLDWVLLQEIEHMDWTQPAAAQSNEGHAGPGRFWKSTRTTGLCNEVNNSALTIIWKWGQTWQLLHAVSVYYSYPLHRIENYI